MFPTALGKLQSLQISSGSATGWHHDPRSKDRGWTRGRSLSLCHSRNSGPHLGDLLTVTMRQSRPSQTRHKQFFALLPVNTKKWLLIQSVGLDAILRQA